MNAKGLRLGLIVSAPLCVLVLGALLLRSGIDVTLAEGPVLSVTSAWPPIHTNLSHSSTKGSRATDVDTNGDDLIAVWSEGTTEGSTSYNGVIRMAWNGISKGGWTYESVYSEGGYLGLRPSVAVFGKTAHFSWVSKVSTSAQYRVAYRAFNLTTGLFSPIEYIYPASGLTGEELGDARVAVDSSGVPHVVWTRTYLVGGEPRDRIYYSHRGSGGWLSAQRLSGANAPVAPSPDVGLDSSAYSEDMPALVASGSEIYVAWREKSAGDTAYGIYVRQRSALGTWSPGGSGLAGYRLSDHNMDEFPTMDAAGSRVYVMWDRYLRPECDFQQSNCYQVYSITYRVLTGPDIGNDWRPSDHSRDLTIDDVPITALSSITTPLNPQNGLPNLLPPGQVPSPEGYFSGARPSLQVVSAGGVYTPYVVWHHWDNEGHDSDAVNPAQPCQIRGAYAGGDPGNESWEYLDVGRPFGVIRAMGAEGVFASPFLALTPGSGGEDDVHVVLNVRSGDEGSPWDVLYTNLYSFNWVYLSVLSRAYP